MSEKARILIVDDEKHIRDSVSELLIDNDYDAGAAASGEEALTKLNDESFDIVLLDVKMPKMSGIQLLEKIKTDHPGVDIIMITGYGTINMAVESLKLDAYDFLVKPCDNAKLIEALHRLVEKRTIEDNYKDAVKALRETNEYLENLFNYANAPIIAWDPQFKITRFNYAVESLTGRSADEVIGKSLEILFPPDSVERLMELIKKTQRGEQWKGVEINILHLDGSVRTVLWNSANIFDPDGKTLVATIAQGQDITERKKSEGALRKSEELYKSLVETTDTGYVIIDHEGKVFDANQEYVRLSGHKNIDEIRGRSVIEWTAAYEQEKNAMAIAKCARDGFIRNLEIDYVNGQGKVTPIEINATVVEKDGMPRILTLCRDITERKQAEDKLKKYSEKLEEMGEEQTRKLLESHAVLIHTGKMVGLGILTGGIAHEVNNPLASILTYAQLILSKSEKGALSLDTAVDYAGKIEEVAKHCKSTIQNLLDFSREPEGKANFFSVKEAILASVSLLAHQMNLQGITVVNDVEDATIFSYRSHLMEVLVDVLTNAKDAMPDGGEIRIATGLEDDCVNISISDTGTGIRQEDMDKIFDPFFTTKEPGQGTGLGLYLCYRIMENLGGGIDVKSVVDKGTTVTIKLPIGKH